MKLNKLTHFEIKKKLAKLAIRADHCRILLNAYYSGFKDDFKHVYQRDDSRYHYSFAELAQCNFEQAQKFRKQLNALNAERAKLIALDNKA